MKDANTMTKRELRDEVLLLRSNMRHSAGLKCPNCDDQGFMVIPGIAFVDDFGKLYQEPVQQQCEFCYTMKGSVFQRQEGGTKTKLDPAPQRLEFIFTVPNKKANPQMCYRTLMPYTPMDRWVRCRVERDVVLCESNG